MKYSLTLSLDSIEELSSVVQKLGSSVTSAELKAEPVEVPEVIQEKKTPAKKAKKTEAPQTFEAPATEEMESVPSPFAKAAVPVPPVEQEPVVQQVATPTANSGFKAGAIERAKYLVTQLTAAGVQTQVVAGTITSILSTLNHAPAKVGELDDATLVKFMPMFENAVSQLLPQNTSFV